MDIDFYEEALKVKDDMLKDIATLIEIPSVYDENTVTEDSPYGINCKKALEKTLELGKRDGYKVENIASRAGHILIGEGENAVGILGHVDVVPVDKSGWHTDPFKMEIKDGAVYGRGVADDKGPLMAGYYGAKIIDRLGLLNGKQVRLIFGSDEERGSSCMAYYASHVETPTCSFTPDGEFPVSYAEKQCVRYLIDVDFKEGDLVSIKGGSAVNIVCDKVDAVVNKDITLFDDYNDYLKENGLTGSIESKNHQTYFNLRGIPAHGSLPERGKNAATYLCHYLASKINSEVVDYIDKYYHDDTTATHLKVNHTGKLGPLSMNVGIIDYKNNHLHLGLDFRTSHECKPAYIKAGIDASLKGLNPTIDEDISEALYIDPNSDLVKKLHKAYVDITGEVNASPQIMSGGTYAKHMPNCVAFGNEFPGHDVHMHEDNENTLVEDLVKGCAIYAKALYLLLNEE